MTDFYASHRHLVDHLAPVWHALPDRGRFYVAHRPLVDHAASLGIEARFDVPQMPGPLTVVASYADYTQCHPERPIAYLEHGAGQAYCVAPDTRVLTADLRWIPASTVMVGDELVAFDESHVAPLNARGWRTATVEQLSTLVQPCYRLTMADGTKLVASADHRWLRRNRGTGMWLETSKLQPANLFPLRTSKLLKLFEPWEEDRTWGAGYLAAAFDGEGCLTQTARPPRGDRLMLAFTQKDNPMLALVGEALRERGFSFSVSTTRIGVRHLHVTGGVAAIYRFLGSIRPRRLLGNFRLPSGGKMQGIPVSVLESEYIGEQPVVGIRTSTGTFVAEGFASHNSDHPTHGAYSGGRNRHRVRLFLTLNEVTAARERAAYPDAEVVIVGSPHLDALALRRGETTPTAMTTTTAGRSQYSAQRPVVACAFHWNCTIVPETRATWTEWRHTFADLAAHGWTVLGHGHPRIWRELEPWYERHGIEPVPDFGDVVDRADLVCFDNSSCGYEAAALGIPVVALNGKAYRRDVHHGLRFWDMVPGPQANSPDGLLHAIDRASKPEWRRRRAEITRHVYPPHTRGRAAELAAAALTRIAIPAA